jgi:hypothetical protein
MIDNGTVLWLDREIQHLIFYKVNDWNIIELSTFTATILKTVKLISKLMNW